MRRRSKIPLISSHLRPSTTSPSRPRSAISLAGTSVDPDAAPAQVTQERLVLSRRHGTAMGADRDDLLPGASGD